MPVSFIPTTDLEAREELRSMARHGAGRAMPDALVELVMRGTEGGDWPVRRAAMEALNRRFAAAARDELTVEARPGRGLGEFVVRSSSGARSYRTLLVSLEPFDGSCDCPDFLTSSLGCCKHLAVAAQHALRRAKSRTARPVAAPLLRWDPVRPLTGAGDWLGRVWLEAEISTPIDRWFTGGAGRRTLSEDAIDGQRAAALEAFAAAIERAEISADPVLPPLIAHERARLARRTEGRGLVADLDTALASLQRRPYPYQRAGVERFLSEGRLLLADDMGLGKTIQAICASHALVRAGRVRKGLIVVPASLKLQWLREWQEWTDVSAQVLDDAQGRQTRLASDEGGFLITNYEQVMRDPQAFRRWNPDLVVLDEAQRIKNWATKTSAAVKSLSPPLRLVLTGTPMENRLDELASLLDWVDETALAPKWRLAPWHSQLADGTRQTVGARNLDTLRARLSPCLLRRRKSEVLAELPERTDVRLPVPMTPEQTTEHDLLKPPIAQLMARAQRRPLTQAEFLKLMQLLTEQRLICNGMALRDWDAAAAERRRDPTDRVLASLASPKLGEFRSLVETVAVEEERKIVVFSQWVRMLELARWAVQDLLRREGLRAVFFTGRENLLRRQQNVIEFHDDPTVRVFLASDAGGVGLNLQRAASVVVNLDLPWNPAVLEQRVGRIHRHGQTEPISVYSLVAESGIEARIANVVADKQALFTGLFDGTTDSVQYDSGGSFLARVQQLVEPAPGESTPASPVAPEEESEEIGDDIDAIEADADAQALAGDAAAVREPTIPDGAAGERMTAPPPAESIATTPTATPPETRAPAEPAMAPALSQPPMPAAPPAGIDSAATGAPASDVPPIVSVMPLATAPAPFAEVARLASMVTIEPRPDGGVHIEAPREAAVALASLLQSLAQGLLAAGGGARQ